MSYNHEINLLVHVAIIHPNQCSVDNTADINYRCLVCSLHFTRKKALQGHCLVHQVDEELFCDQCAASFNSRIILDKHIADHENEMNEPAQISSLRCKICQETFNNIGHIKRHYKQCHQKNEKVVEDQCEEIEVKTEKDGYQNFDPSIKRRSSKIASQTIKLYAQGKLKLHESPRETSDSKKRGRPRKAQGVSKQMSKNDVICNVCQRTFKTPILLRRHEVTHTGIKEFECPICQKKFTQKSSVKIHMVVHDEVKAFKCQSCHKAFTYEHNMITHIKTVHRSEGDNKNPQINQNIHQPNETYLNNDNKNIVEDQQSMECYLTNGNDSIQNYITFDNDTHGNYGVLASILCDQNKLSDSLVQEDGEVSQYLWQDSQLVCKNEIVPPSTYKKDRIRRNPYIPSTSHFSKIDWDKSQTVTENRGILLSEEVDKLDKETGQVQVHEVIRDQITGFKRFRCRFCKKLYRKSCDLSRHVRIHTQHRPFKCYLCHKSFRLKSVLKNHFKSHWKLKEFPCELCSKSFNLKQTLMVHLRLHNPSDMKYSCDICQKRFNSSSHYNYHNRTQHREPPDHCLLNSGNMISQNLEPLILDSSLIKRHPFNVNRPYKCHHCDKSYKLKKYLKAHLKDNINVNCRKMCSYCDKSFMTVRSLQQHSRTQHINRRAFTCSQCPASFILKSSLTRHGLVHSTSKPYACPLCFRRFKAKLYCDRHLSLQKCTKRMTKFSQNETIGNKLVSNLESEIQTTEQASESYCNFRLMDLDMNTSEDASNILVTNYVNDFSDKFMVVSLDGQKNEVHQSDETNYYMEDRTHGDNCSDNMIGMLENQIGVNPVEVGAMYNYGTTMSGQLLEVGDSHNMLSYQQQSQQSDNIYYYQNLADIDDPLPKVSLADKFPILKATLFADDDHNMAQKPLKSANTIIYCQENNLNPLDSSIMNMNSSHGKLFHGCANCNEQFLNSETLIRHVKSTHKIAKDFVCKVCHKAFSVPLSLWAHSKIHDTVHVDTAVDDFLLCIACNQKFISVPSLSRHVRMQHNDKLNLYRCIHCQVTYKTTRELDSHIKQLNSDYDAIIINSQLVTNSNRSESFKRISRDIKDPNYCKEYQIELENSEIDQIASLDVSKTTKLSMQELIKAAKQKRGSGRPCQESKSDNYQLDPLLSYPYSCSLCHKGFNRASNLQQHLSVHTKMTPYQCQKCNRKFRHRCSLKTHENTKHSVMTKLLRCHLCLRLLRSQVALRNHMKVHLKNYSYRCETCLKTFSTHQEQLRHGKLKQCNTVIEEPEKTVVDEPEKPDETTQKTVTCVTCSVSFSSIAHYEGHQCSKQKRSPHQCILCDNTFLSSVDLCSHICDVHKQQTKHKCHLCNLLFVNESLLMKHKKSVHKLKVI